MKTVALLLALLLILSLSGCEEKTPSHTTTEPIGVDLTPDNLLDPDEPMYYGIAAGLQERFYTAPTRMHIVGFLSAPIFTDVCVEVDATQAPEKAVSLSGTGTLRKITKADLNPLLKETFGMTIEQAESFAKVGMCYVVGESAYYFREEPVYTGNIVLKNMLLDHDRGILYTVYQTEECLVRVTLKQTENGYIITSCEKTTDTVLEEPTEPTTEPTAEPTTEPEETEPELELDWYIENPQYLSYEEYFDTDHPFETANPSYIRQGDTLYLLRIERAQNNRALTVKIGKTNHTVPGSETLADYTCFGTDRHYAYLHSDTDVVRVDLLTGEQETVLTYERLLDIRLLGDVVLRCCIQEGDSCNIYQMYLPTGDTKLLYGGLPGDTPLRWFSLTGPYSTQGTVSWSMINPDMAAILQKELANPNSIYITFDGKDFSAEWSTLASTLYEEYDYDTRIPILMHDIQEHTGVHAWARFMYNPADGTCEKKTGIVDTCWFGSGYGHDHYDPYEYDVTPTWNVSEPVPISNISLPENPEEMYERDIYESINSGCQYGYGSVYRPKSQDVLQILFDIDLTGITYSDDYVYGITPDNTVVQASYDGTVRNTIYTGNGTLSELYYACGKLYFLDDGTLMEIDIPAKTYRSLLDVPYLTWMMMDAPDVLYLEVVRGLTADGFVADVSKMTLEDVPYRL